MTDRDSSGCWPLIAAVWASWLVIFGLLYLVIR